MLVNYVSNMQQSSSTIEYMLLYCIVIIVDCPDDCFSRGKCITMRELAQNQVMSREIYDKFEFVYDNIWDHDMIRGCKCDVGYFGTSCGSSKLLRIK
jgi:hypothetical protein